MRVKLVPPSPQTEPSGETRPKQIAARATRCRQRKNIARGAFRYSKSPLAINPWPASGRIDQSQRQQQREPGVSRRELDASKLFSSIDHRIARAVPHSKSSGPARGSPWTGSISRASRRLDCVRSDNEQRDTRAGFTVALPIDRNNLLKLSASTSSDFSAVSLAWQLRWGNGH